MCRSRFSATTGSSSVSIAACGGVWGMRTSWVDATYACVTYAETKIAVPRGVPRSTAAHASVSDGLGGTAPGGRPGNAQVGHRCDHGRMTWWPHPADGA